MLEDQILIDQILNIEGRDLFFSIFDIKAIPGFSTLNLVDNNNMVIGTEYQAFNVYTSAKNCLDNAIKEGDLFYMLDSLYQYNFKVSNDPIMQTDAWARFPAIYINKEEI